MEDHLPSRRSETWPGLSEARCFHLNNPVAHTGELDSDRIQVPLSWLSFGRVLWEREEGRASQGGGGWGPPGQALESPSLCVVV